MSSAPLRMNLTCFSSLEPSALNATKVFDFNNDHEDLWLREAQLPLCTSCLAPPQLLCLVCLQTLVYVVCRNLTAHVSPVMEGVGVAVDIMKSGKELLLLCCCGVSFTGRRSLS